MIFPWQHSPPVAKDMATVKQSPVLHRLPWEPLPFELIKNPVTGLWPGQIEPTDLPDFLRRKTPK